MTTMRAAVQHEYGPADTVRVEQVEVPAVPDDRVLVRVHAVGLDRSVPHVMTGTPYLVRLMGYGVRRPKQPVLGLDLAGVVEAVGAKVADLKPGDEVYGAGAGTFAEYALARPRALAAKPASLTMEEAAAVPTSALTALQALRDHGKVAPGQTVLVVGAGGGVGTYAVQIAKAMGAEVTAVCSAGKIDLVRSLGADHIVDYRREAIGSTGCRYDVVLDIGGGRSLRELRGSLAERGHLVFIGGEQGGDLLGVGRQVRGMLLSPFVKQHLTMFVARSTTADLDELSSMIAAGTLRPAIDRVCTLDEVPAALVDMQHDRIRGKVVIGIV